MEQLKHAGLFAGGGGFELAAKWMGWDTVFWSEINPFCRQILSHHFPEAEALGDITTTDFTKYYGTIDILTGGFPCQPYSTSGKRKGTEDVRHLWPHMLRAIREISPPFVVGENVHGIVSWDGGSVFQDIITALEAEGYEVAPVVFPACALGAPHERYRTWFVAYSPKLGGHRWGRTGNGQATTETIGSEVFSEAHRPSQEPATTHTTGTGLQQRRGPYRWQETTGQRASVWGTTESPSQEPVTTHTHEPRGGENYGAGKPEFAHQDGTIGAWHHFPTQSPVCGRDDGLSSRLDGDTVFKGVKRSKRSNTFGRWRSESIKMYGNAIVPQMAYEIFKAIIQSLK